MVKVRILAAIYSNNRKLSFLDRLANQTAIRQPSNTFTTSTTFVLYVTGRHVGHIRGGSSNNGVIWQNAVVNC